MLDDENDSPADPRPAAPMSRTAVSLLQEVVVHGPVSRAQLARRLGLSAAAVTRLSRPLVAAGLLVESDAVAAGAMGRPSTPLDVDEHFAHVVGIKLTGDRLFAVLTTVRGRVLRSVEHDLLDPSVEHVVDLVDRVVRGLGAGDPALVGIGISLSGNATRDEPTVRASPFLHWRGVPLATMVSDLTRLPTVLDNDVRALTAAEHWFGAAAGARSFALLTVGAGIGLGMVTHGEQVDGRHGASGLIGHLPVDDRGPLCYAGHRGCAHAYATTTGLARTVSAGHGVSLLTFSDCVELARQGDPVAVTAFAEAGRAIGHLIAVVVNILGPDRVLVSGEGAAMYELGRDAAEARLAELLHWTAEPPDVLVRPLGFTEWARGAAVVAVQQHVRSLWSTTSTEPTSTEPTSTEPTSTEPTSTEPTSTVPTAKEQS